MQYEFGDRCQNIGKNQRPIDNMASTKRYAYTTDLDVVDVIVKVVLPINANARKRIAPPF